MYKLCYFKHFKWNLHSIGTWDQCLELGHDLFSQDTEWVINQLGNELVNDFTFKNFIVTFSNGNLKASFSSLEEANSYILKNRLTDSKITIK